MGIVIFDGVAYGMLLFLIGVGLSITMGLMNFVNLAHGAFAMLGGYACVMLMTRAGVPFLATLPAAFVVSAAAGIVLERTLYVRLYKAPHLDQVMFSIGLVFMEPTSSTPARIACAFIGAAVAGSRSRMSHAATFDSFFSTSAPVKILPTSP